MGHECLFRSKCPKTLGTISKAETLDNHRVEIRNAPGGCRMQDDYEMFPLFVAKGPNVRPDPEQPVAVDTQVEIIPKLSNNSLAIKGALANQLRWHA